MTSINDDSDRPEAAQKHGGNSINWDDDGGEFDAMFAEDSAQDDSTEFAELLQGSDSGDHDDVQVGDRVDGRLSVIGDDPLADVLVDLGGKNSGVIPRTELCDPGGELRYKNGDSIQAYVVSRRRGDLILSFAMGQQKSSLADLENAKDERIPLRGKVASVNKGGFEVTIAGRRAFCPLSQIDLRSVIQPESFVGQELEFLISRLEEDGRNIVVSRAALLRLQAKTEAERLLENLDRQAIHEGQVTEIRDFGAFVDLGGVDGLVHISEIAHSRVSRPGDVVTVGDSVKVVIKEIDLSGDQPRISLSMKDAQKDPWDHVEDYVKQGESYKGRVTSLQNFGAFVALEDGLEGLVHISEMSWGKRIHHPKEVVAVGDIVEVAVRDIDSQNKRLGLTMKSREDDPWYKIEERFQVGQLVTGQVERLKPFGVFVRISDGGLDGLLPIGMIKRVYGEAYRKTLAPGRTIEVRVDQISPSDRQLRFGLPEVDDDEDGRLEYENYLQRRTKEKAAAETTVPKGDSNSKLGSLGELLKEKLQR